MRLDFRVLWDLNNNGGGNLGWQYYEDMAWGGPAQGNEGAFYDEFLSHNPDSADRTRILNTISNEAENSNDSSQNGLDCN